MLYSDYVNTLFDFAQDAYTMVNSKGYDAFRNKVYEEDDPVPVPVKGTRHPSTRHERWKLTTDHKKADRQKAEALGMNSPWKEPTHSKWIDPYLKHSISAGDWRLALKGKTTSKKRREDSKKEVEQFWRTASDYPELTDEVWEQAWRDWEEEQYWDRIDAEEWEDMKTYEEVEEFYREEEEHRSGLARDLSSARDGLARDTEPEDDLEDADLSSVTVVTNNSYVLERGVTCQGMRFVCEDEEAARWLFHRLSAFYPSSTDFSPKFVRNK